MPLVPERGRSASVDITRTFGPTSYTVTLFASRIKNPIDVERGERYELINLSEPTTNVGTELLATFRKAPFTLTGSYTYVHAVWAKLKQQDRTTYVVQQARVAAGLER